MAFTSGRAVLAQENSAEGESVQPYIDSVKEELDETHPVPKHGAESYIESIQKKLREEDPDQELSSQDPNGGYIDQLRRDYPEKLAPPPAAPDGALVQPYIDAQKLELEPKESGGAIQAVKDGTSELKARRDGNIHHAFGLKYGASLTRNITAPAGTAANNFNDIYGANYAPDLSFFYEYQPFHSEWLGNIGIIGMAGVGYFSGNGRYPFALNKPGGGQFGLTAASSRVQFFSLPVTVGVDYRFNLFRILRPYVMVGPTAIGYLEIRLDGGSSFRGVSSGFLAQAGVSLLLDWLSRGASWDAYAEHGIKHSYLTLDYTRLTTFSGDVNFAVDGIVAGLAFEY